MVDSIALFPSSSLAREIVLTMDLSSAYFPPEIAHMIASHNNRPLSEEEYLS